MRGIAEISAAITPGSFRSDAPSASAATLLPRGVAEIVGAELVGFVEVDTQPGATTIRCTLSEDAIGGRPRSGGVPPDCGLASAGGVMK